MGWVMLAVVGIGVVWWLGYCAWELFKIAADRPSEWDRRLEAAERRRLDKP
jgi:hypothetical protein